jgi:hypothetical protein
MTTLLALALLGVLLGFGGAFGAKALRDGRRGAALAVALVLAPIVAYLAWLALMVFGVGPAMR